MSTADLAGLLVTLLALVFAAALSTHCHAFEVLP
jgi:hypothetical protein